MSIVSQVLVAVLYCFCVGLLIRCFYKFLFAEGFLGAAINGAAGLLCGLIATVLLSAN
jgi:hypothetical protein